LRVLSDYGAIRSAVKSKVWARYRIVDEADVGEALARTQAVIQGARSRTVVLLAAARAGGGDSPQLRSAQKAHNGPHGSARSDIPLVPELPGIVDVSR
jgi:hypothetical protein